MLHAQAFQRLGDQLVAGAVEGGVHHLEGVGHFFHHGLVVDLCHDVGEELLVGLGTHEGDLPLCHGGVIVHGFDAAKHIQLPHLLSHFVSVLGGQLGAVLPIDLVAVVLLGVVASGDVDAGDAAVLPDGEAQLGGGAQGLEQAHGDTVAGHDAGGLPGENVGVVAAVEADGYAPLHGLGTLGQYDLSKGLGGMADDVDVHPVQANAHGAAQTGGAEGQLVEEAGLDLLGIVLNGFQLRFFVSGQGGTVQPFFVLFHEIHFLVPPLRFRLLNESGRHNVSPVPGKNQIS